jgi:hypothetical protein
MAINTILVNIVVCRVNPWDSFSFTCCVWQQGVAAQTLFTRYVYDEKLRLVRVVQGRTVAILAGYDSVQVLGADIHDIIVAFSAVFMHFLLARVTVLERLVFPYVLIGFVVKAVHETIFTRAKIVRDIKRPEDKERGNYAYDHKQWSPNMTFHDVFPLFLMNSLPKI